MKRARWNVNKLVRATVEQLERFKANEGVVAQDGQLVLRHIQSLKLAQGRKGASSQVGQIIRAHHQGLLCRALRVSVVNSLLVFGPVFSLHCSAYINKQ